MVAMSPPCRLLKGFTTSSRNSISRAKPVSGSIDPAHLHERQDVCRPHVDELRPLLCRHVPSHHCDLTDGQAGHTVAMRHPTHIGTLRVRQGADTRAPRPGARGQVRGARCGARKRGIGDAGVGTEGDGSRGAAWSRSRSRSTGTTCRRCSVGPPAAAPRVGVAIATEAQGVNNFIKGVGVELAEHGYVSVIPDYYHGTGPEDPEILIDVAHMGPLLDAISSLDFRRGAEDMLAGVDLPQGARARLLRGGLGLLHRRHPGLVGGRARTRHRCGGAVLPESADLPRALGQTAAASDRHDLADALPGPAARGR